jgi:hypothetical protein
MGPRRFAPLDGGSSPLQTFAQPDAAQDLAVGRFVAFLDDVP